MKKQLKHIFAEFMEKMRFKYRISIVNENTLEETWYTRLSRISVVLFVTGFFLLTFIFLTLIIFATPLRHYLPGFEDSGNRAVIVQQSIRVDSLENQLQLMGSYYQVLKNHISETTSVDSVKSLDSVTIRERATVLMEKSKRESEFVKQYEETEKYNLGSINTIESDKKVFVFFRPVEGVVASTFNPKEEKFGISIITSPQETVKSVLEGRVVYAGYTFDNQWVIHLQHDNDYLSIYKNNTRLLKNVGDYVKAGQSIAITGSDENVGTNKHFYFELWKKGTPVNPQDVITFRF
ncbi:MAG: M23 family metallopeptidase [Paludibacteraceae bacterium]|nr:M23 family metallopeptidase [Paludibacteraceae bacterium]